MNKVITIKKNADEAVRDYLTHLLEKGLINGVLTTAKNGNDDYTYAFITDAGDMKSADPLAPAMPENGGTVLSSLTPAKKKIAAVLRPCEQRAFIERVKREQGSLKNVLIISMTCGGVYPLKTLGQPDEATQRKNHIKALSKGTIPRSVRPTCKACEHFIPFNADITVSLVGEENLNSETRLFLNSPEAVEISNQYGESAGEGTLDEKRLNEYRALRMEAKEALFGAVVSGKDGLKELVNVFGRCIGCHGCSRVCPICYCVLCDFESHIYDYDESTFKSELEMKGALRLPPDTLYFHLGRLSHMSFSCVGCGQCADVCPADIPVSAIFMKTGEQTAGLFDYIPGRDVEEDIPVMVFKEEEFPELGE